MSTVTRSWLERLYSDSPGYWTLVLFRKGKVHHTFWLSGESQDLNNAAKTIKNGADQYDFYTSVGTWEKPGTPTERGSARNVISLAGFWADLDIGSVGHQPAKSGLPNPSSTDEALSILEDFPEPSAIVHTGGGLHVWHMFDEPWEFAGDNKAAAEVTKSWQRAVVEAGKEHGFHVDSLGDLARILRVPGSQNHKAGLHRPVVITKGSSWWPTYPLAELSSRGISASGSAEDNAAVADQVSDIFPLSWAEILEPHNWKLDHTDGVDTYWRRPGKSKADGHSAVAHPSVFVNFSESAGLPTGEGNGLSKLRLYALLRYGGDEKAARQAIDLMPVSADHIAEVAQRFSYAKLDWPTLWTEESKEPEWLLDPLIEEGKLIAIYSEAKDGKSLLLLEACLKLSEGDPIWTHRDKREPMSIVYVDKENTVKDLRERAAKMGYEGNPLVNLHYYSFPNMAFFDSPEGGKELFGLAKAHDAKLVVLDTLSRVVEGDEIDNNTYINFYKYTGVLFKPPRISLIRLDHAGKDAAKGMRGASSKRDDVDAVWWLRNDHDNREDVYLERTHTRSNNGADKLHLLRRDDPLRHELAEDAEVIAVTLEGMDDGEQA